MAKNMENGIVEFIYGGSIGNLIGIMEKKMEATI